MVKKTDSTEHSGSKGRGVPDTNVVYALTKTVSRTGTISGYVTS